MPAVLRLFRVGNTGRLTRGERFSKILTMPNTNADHVPAPLRYDVDVIEPGRPRWTRRVATVAEALAAIPVSALYAEVTDYTGRLVFKLGR